MHESACPYKLHVRNSFSTQAKKILNVVALSINCKVVSNSGDGGEGVGGGGGDDDDDHDDDDDDDDHDDDDDDDDDDDNDDDDDDGDNGGGDGYDAIYGDDNYAGSVTVDDFVMGVAVILMGDVDNNGDGHVLTLRFVPRTIIYWKLRRAFPSFFSCFSC